jgi:cytochrome P450
MRSGSGIVFNPDVEDWKGHRRLFKRFVASIVGPDASRIILRNARNFTDHMLQFPDKTQINITEAMHNLSLDLTAELAFGIELKSVTGTKSKMSEGIKSGIAAWMNSFHHFLVYPRYWELLPRFFLRWTIGIIPASKLILDLENLGNIEKEIFDTRQDRNHKDNDSGASFLGSLSDMLEENKDDTQLIHGLLQDIREMLAGGSDTSANTLAYTLYFISHHPEVEKRVFKEIEEKFDESDCKGSVESMPYLSNVVKESLRMLPPGSLILRKSGQDDYFGKYFIPKDVQHSPLHFFTLSSLLLAVYVFLPLTDQCPFEFNVYIHLSQVLGRPSHLQPG